MIEIVTLFLSLVFGPQIVEVDVHPDVASVEIVVDGETVERLDGPLWSGWIDFGPMLRAHRLEAVALDEDGRELDRAIRFLNLGHHRQAGRMVLVEDKRGRPEAVRLRWESVGQRAPIRLEMFFDGEPIPVDDPRHVELPSFDPDQFHFVSAVLHFDNGGTDRLELGFGGRLGMEVSTELTAVAVLPRPGEKPPDEDELARAFRHRDTGRPLRVHGVKKCRAEVVFVRDAGVQLHLDDLVASLAGEPRTTAWMRGHALQAMENDRPNRVRLPDSVGRVGRLPLRTKMRLLAPRAAPLEPVGVSADMFLVSPPLGTADRGLLAVTVEEEPQQFEKQVASAVALAGLIAHGTNRPRAVVLLLGEGGDDVSRTSELDARSYLGDLGVPFFVWAFEPLPDDSPWGAVQSLGEPGDFRGTKRGFIDAADRLADALARQRLVWIEGSHLPREVELVPDIETFFIPGRKP